MEEKPKVIYKVRKSTGKTVAIVVLVLLLLSALSYIGYTKYKELTKKEIIEEKEVREEMYYNEVEEILDQIDLYNQIFKSKYPISAINKVDNQLKLQFGILALKETKNINNYYERDDFKEVYNKYFTKDFKVIYEDIDCPIEGEVIYELNNDTKKYTFVDNHGHGAITMDVNTYFVSGEIKEDKYIINTNILYSNYCSGVCNPEGGYYDSYEACITGKSPVTYRISQYEEIKEDLPITTFTFVKDSDNFRLESVKIDS